MAECKVIEYKGIEIVFTDISNSKPSESIKAFEASVEIISSKPLRSVYALVDAKGAKFNKELVDKIKEVVKRNNVYNKATVVTGLDAMNKLMAQSIAVLTGRQIKFTSSVEEGLEYLFSQSN